MKFQSVCVAAAAIVILAASSAFCFEGQAPVRKALRQNAAQRIDAAAAVVRPTEPRERVADIDPKLRWENWRDRESIPSSPTLELTKPVLSAKTADALDAIFLNYRLVVCWNGQEGESGRELAILSVTGKAYGEIPQGKIGVALSIFPLKGKLTKASRVGSDIEDLTDLFSWKFASRHEQYEERERDDSPQRAPYCAFETEAQNFETFKRSIDSALNAGWKGAETAFAKEDRKTLESYFARGITNFLCGVFDFDKRGESSFIKTATAVEFQSDRPYIPAEIAKIGSHGEEVSFDVLVLSPKRVEYSSDQWFDKKDQDYTWTLAAFPNPLSEEPLTFSYEELRGRSKSAADFFRENGVEEVYGFELMGRFLPDEIDCDLELVPVDGAKDELIPLDFPDEEPIPTHASDPAEQGQNPEIVSPVIGPTNGAASGTFPTAHGPTNGAASGVVPPVRRPLNGAPSGVVPPVRGSSNGAPSDVPVKTNAPTNLGGE